MKTNKMIYALAFALVFTLAATGCRHKPVSVTKIPGSPSPMPPDIGTGGTIGGNGSQIGGGPTANISPGDYNEDPLALAAYTIHFAYDSSVIRKSEHASLQSVASALAADRNAMLKIEGNCDERGTEEYNRALGERRALAAREALAKLGLDPQRIRTESFGKDKPAVDGHDEAAWSKNRRDDFVLLHPKGGA